MDLNAAARLAAGKTVQQLATFGVATLACYFLLYRFEDAILATSSRGGVYFIEPVAIAFLFSYVHGNFTAHFWDFLGIRAKKQ